MLKNIPESASEWLTAIQNYEVKVFFFYLVTLDVYLCRQQASPTFLAQEETGSYWSSS